MKYIANLLILITAFVAPSCADSLGSGEDTPQTKLLVQLNMPQLPDGAKILQPLITVFNISTQSSTLYNPNEEISLLPGLYDISYSANVDNPGAAVSTLRGRVAAVQITGEHQNVTIDIYNNIESDDLIIEEIFFAGTLQSSGNSYYGDDYIKLYNNTDHVIYADGLTLFESKFLTTEKRDYTPDIMHEAMTVQALYTIPGSGTDVPVQPGESLLLADTGIDHRVANPNSFDLSKADFEWYDVSTKPSSMDIDGPVANLDKWYCYTQSFWVLHNRGFKTFGIARIPIDRDTYLKDYYYSYDYIQVTIAGDFPMTQSAYRLPNEWIVDVVNTSVDAQYAWNLCAPHLDSGWTGCGTIDHDKTRYFHSVRRKLLYVTEGGRAVYKDTNNSSEDFNRMCVASEIENQGTAMDSQGTLCTTKTYDGVTPR
ncbi:MAG: DUF4876 domain-containing protein [Muribaculaceae bacterium]|nr:DUF4876 domain-containing protein [Muribaculaceae bacterium]